LRADEQARKVVAPFLIGAQQIDVAIVHAEEVDVGWYKSEQFVIGAAHKESKRTRLLGDRRINDVALFGKLLLRLVNERPQRELAVHIHKAQTHRRMEGEVLSARALISRIVRARETVRTAPSHTIAAA
jgi:hypothetical protein